jgi:hypothetical protein
VFGGRIPVDGTAVGAGAAGLAVGTAVGAVWQVMVTEPVATALPTRAVITAVPGCCGNDVKTVSAMPALTGAVGGMLPSVVVKPTLTPLLIRLPKASVNCASTDDVLPQLMVVGVMRRRIVAGGPETEQVTVMANELLTPPDVAVIVIDPLMPTGTRIVADAEPPTVKAVTAAWPLLAEKTTAVPSGTTTPRFVTVAVTTTEVPQTTLLADTLIAMFVAPLALPDGKTLMKPTDPGTQLEP